MRSAAWEVARPERPGRVAGVSMAGFRVPGVPAGGLRMVPHPAVMLILEFGASSPLVEDGAGRRQRGSLVAGPGFGLGGGVRARGENVACVQVRLSPVVARTVLGVSPAELGGAMVALDDVWGRQASRIGERLDELPSWQARFAATDAWLNRLRQQARSPVDPEVAWAWRRMVRSRGLVRVDHLAAEVGWSRKRLWTRFHAQLGLPPKRAARLIRFDHAAHRLVAGHPPSHVAADTGYTDQSHLHRDTRTFTALTPAALAAEPFLTIDPVAWPAPAAARDSA
ncbi:AraC family transcriptional regulator [Streptomyces sp. CBMA29]|uniref:AraC family transcriptional regulator n=1 Tax=Streptomyces sp. CBMA29 TaxID=1896314 RepID=UPI0016618B01|nr:helix-turn-helix domain-containing protein [Streptomyces sp. CBMA29]MBD0739053.1 AraC family transcriptional regulator [Streptomyces sp. CBMA29]